LRKCKRIFAGAKILRIFPELHAPPSGIGPTARRQRKDNELWVAARYSYGFRIIGRPVVSENLILRIYQVG